MRTSGAAAVVIALLVAACGGDDGGPFGGFSPPANESPPSPRDGRDGPPSTPVRIHKGKATVTVSGGFNRRLVLPPGPGSVYAPPRGQVALTWLDRDGNALIMRGSSFRGTAKTSSDLALSLVLQAGQPFVFVGGVGECTVTLTTVKEKSFAGNFRCAQLSAKGKTIQARGSIIGHR